VTFVLDASVTLAWLLGDERSAEADGVLERLRKGRALVPALWISETANGLIAAERRGRITKQDTSLAIELLDALPIEIVPEARDTLPRVHRLGVDLGLTAYDATYLDLAIGTRSELATLDDDLRRAARARRVKLVR